MFQKSAKPVAKTLSSSSHKKRVREADAAMTPTPFSTSSSLVHLCRMVITTNLERYPPEAFGVCDGDEWETLVRLRHARTQPKRRWRSSGNHSSCAPGSLSSTSNHSTASSVENGGIDGTGRMVPAIADKIMIAIEICNPHLSDCETTDYLVWKDCVEYKFRRGTCSSRSGAALLMTRPTALLLPWPILIQNLQRYASRLVPLSSSTQSSCEDISEAIEALRTTPMNVTLLKDSGVGKIVKKAIKRVDVEHKEQLEGLLAIWMVMAQEDGVVSGDATMVKATSTKHDDASSKTTRTDLKLAATCQSWRHLFRVLWNRNEEIRTQQGKRMREIRNNLAKTRPKLVKVRPTVSAQQERLLERSSGQPPGSSDSTSHSVKTMSLLRKETTIRASCQKSKAPSISATKPKALFGDAVAFASRSKKGLEHTRKHIGGTIQHLGEGKRMKVPTQIVQGAGPRQFASKWKTAQK